MAYVLTTWIYSATEYRWLERSAMTEAMPHINLPREVGRSIRDILANGLIKFKNFRPVLHRHDQIWCHSLYRHYNNVAHSVGGVARQLLHLIEVASQFRKSLKKMPINKWKLWPGHHLSLSMLFIGCATNQKTSLLMHHIAHVSNNTLSNV
jgi:hypothetical protein